MSVPNGIAAAKIFEWWIRDGFYQTAKPFENEFSLRLIHFFESP